jgi:hypothetical protein
VKYEISSGLWERNTLPPQQATFNCSNLIGRELAKAAQEILRRQCLNSLHKECALVKKSRRHRHLKLRTARGRGVWNHADQSAVPVPVRNANDKSRANLLRYAKVHLPDFSAFRHAASSPPRPKPEKMPQPRPRNRRPSNHQTWGRARRLLVEALAAPVPRAAQPHQEFGQLLASCCEHTRAKRIEQAPGHEDLTGK